MESLKVFDNLAKKIEIEKNLSTEDFNRLTNLQKDISCIAEVVLDSATTNTSFTNSIFEFSLLHKNQSEHAFRGVTWSEFKEFITFHNRFVDLCHEYISNPQRSDLQKEILLKYKKIPTRRLSTKIINDINAIQEREISFIDPQGDKVKLKIPPKNILVFLKHKPKKNSSIEIIPILSDNIKIREMQLDCGPEYNNCKVNLPQYLLFEIFTLIDGLSARVLIPEDSNVGNLEKILKQ